MSGSTSYHAGLSAEQSVEKQYKERGYRIAANRFRTRHGEIDLIAEKDGQSVFVEVKKSRTHARAAERVSPKQVARLFDCAAEYLSTQPGGQGTNSRFDIALVNEAGQIEILENALSA